MSWYVGVALREQHEGPVNFAGWLHRVSTGPGADQRFVGLHVMGPVSALPWAVPDTLRDRVAEGTQEVVRAELRRVGLPEDAPVVLAEGETVEYAMLEALEGTDDARVLVVGRRSNRHDHRFVRLGKTTRRLLRLAQCSVVVVPPDLPPEGPGEGPILLATDLEPEAGAAVGFARRLAESTGRDLVLAISVPHFQWGDVYIATLADERARIDEAERKRAAEALDAWAADHGLTKARKVVVQGDAVHELALLAEKERAAVLVCGTRKPSLLRRFFDVSVSTELAGAAPCPVAVVVEKS